MNWVSLAVCGSDEMSPHRVTSLEVEAWTNQNIQSNKYKVSPYITYTDNANTDNTIIIEYLNN